jgi:hypothetical protein
MLHAPWTNSSVAMMYTCAREQEKRRACSSIHPLAAHLNVPQEGSDCVQSTAFDVEQCGVHFAGARVLRASHKRVVVGIRHFLGLDQHADHVVGQHVGSALSNGQHLCITQQAWQIRVLDVPIAAKCFDTF